MNASKTHLRRAEIVRAHTGTWEICAGVARCLTLTILLVLLLAIVWWGPRLARRAAGLPVANERLLHGIMLDDVQEVRRALAEGASPNAPLVFEQPPLIVATNGHSTAILEALLQAGADVRAVDYHSNTALLHAAMKDRGEFVRLLLKHGADPDQADAAIKPLIGAASYGRCEVVRMLLEAGADVDVRGPGGRTALMFAASADHAEAVQILLQAGADIDAVDDDGDTAAAIAAAADSTAAARLLEIEMKHPTSKRYARKPSGVKAVRPPGLGKTVGPSVVVWRLI